MLSRVDADTLRGIDGPGIRIRDHFRRTPENAGSPRFGLGPLVVLADTEIAANAGFPMHRHQDMEIVTYVVEGALTHEDTLGNRGRLAAGDVQAMTTGTGILHSETNPDDEPVRVYQLWIAPDRAGLTPGYLDVPNPKRGRRNAFCVVAGSRGNDADGGNAGAVINQAACVLSADIDEGNTVEHAFAAGRAGYLIAAKGSIDVSGETLSERDGVLIREEPSVRITALAGAADVLLLDVPA